MKAQLMFICEGHVCQRYIDIPRVSPEIRIPFAPKDRKAGTRSLDGTEPPEFPVVVCRYSHMEGEVAVYYQGKPSSRKTDKS